MKKYLGKLDNRQVILLGIAAVVVISVVFTTELLLPLYSNLTLMQTAVKNGASKHARLLKNLGIRELVNKEFDRLNKQAFQTQSDQITISQFLRDVEELARQPNMMLVNMKPLPVKHEGRFKIYRVRLSAIGKLQDIVKFVSGLTNAENITGLSSLALRGVRGNDMVECSLFIWMVRLLSGDNKTLLSNVKTRTRRM